MVPVFYSNDYLDARYDFDTTRKAGWVAASLRADPIDDVELLEPRPARLAELRLAHTDTYVRAVQTGLPRGLARSSGLGWDRKTYAAVTASTGGVIDAAFMALDTGRVAGTLSSGLHHAGRQKGGGFCTFNGLAIAAAYVRKLKDRAQVLVIDLDAHPGDGTHDIVCEWPWVHQLDISVTGAWYEPEHVSTLDAVSTADRYLPTLVNRLAALDGVPFDLVLYNAGVDLHQDCDIGGLDGITADLLADRDRLVFAWARAQGHPIAFTLAGGYVGQRLSQEFLVTLHRQTIAAASAYSGKQGNS